MHDPRFRGLGVGPEPIVYARGLLEACELPVIRLPSGYPTSLETVCTGSCSILDTVIPGSRDQRFATTMRTYQPEQPAAAASNILDCPFLESGLATGLHD